MAEIMVTVLIADRAKTIRTCRSLDPNTPIEKLEEVLTRAAGKAVGEAVAMASGYENLLAARLDEARAPDA